MRHFWITIILIVGITSQAFTIDFYTGSLQQGLNKAKTENKRILLYFTASWCGPCQQMQKFVFPDPQVHLFTQLNYVAMKFDVDAPGNRELYKQYLGDNTGIPAFALLSSTGTPIKIRVGSYDEEGFLDFLTFENAQHPSQETLVETQNNYEKPGTAWQRFMHHNVSNNRYFGITVGGAWNRFEDTDDHISANSRFGMYIDVHYEWRFERFGVQTAIAYAAKGTKSKDSDDKVRLHYLEIPVQLSYALIPKFVTGQPMKLNLTPYVGVATGGKVEQAGQSTSVNFDRWERVAYGIRPALAFELGNFEPSLGYDFGLSNLYKDTATEAFHRSFFFQVELNFL